MDISGDDPLAWLRRQTHTVLQAGRKIQRLAKTPLLKTEEDSGAPSPNGKGLLEKYGLWVAGGLGLLLLLRRR